MKYLVVIFALVFASPTFASNELQGQPFSKVEEMAAKHGVNIEKLNDADTATMDAATNSRPKPSIIYLLTLNSRVIIILVNDGDVIFSSDPVKLEMINKMLQRTES